MLYAIYYNVYLYGVFFYSEIARAVVEVVIIKAKMAVQGFGGVRPKKVEPVTDTLHRVIDGELNSFIMYPRPKRGKPEVTKFLSTPLWLMQL